MWHKISSIESGLVIASKSQLIEKYFNCCPKALRKCLPELFRIIRDYLVIMMLLFRNFIRSRVVSAFSIISFVKILNKCFFKCPYTILHAIRDCKSSFDDKNSLNTSAIIALISIIYGTFLNIKVIKSFMEHFRGVDCIVPVFLLSMVVLHIYQ